MKKKYAMIGITCCFFISAGICYSCSNKINKDSAKMITSLEESSEPKLSENEINKVPARNNPNDNTLDKSVTVENESSTSLSKKDSYSKTIYVHLCGAVKKPGVYRAKEGERLFAIVKQAGGFTKEADDAYMNQAQKVSDGQRIYIPTKNEVNKLNVSEYIEGTQSVENAKTDQEGKNKGIVNINEANAEKLMELPGIGQAKADKIIEYRNTNGKFNKIEDIMNIPGIKEGLFQKIASYIVV